MKNILWLFILATILISCTEDNIINPCEQYITIKTQEEIIVDMGYKYKLVYNSRYKNGVIDEGSKYLFKKVFFNYFGDEDSTVIWDANGNQTRTSKSLYDSHKNYLGSIDYYQDGSSETTLLFEYFYNDRGLLIRTNDIYRSYISEYFTYVYDSEDRIIENSRFDQYGELINRYINFYDNCTKPLRSEVFDKSGLTGTIRYEYDRFGNVFRYYLKESDSNEEVSIDFHEKFDDQGRRIESHWWGLGKETFTYYPDNLLKSILHFDYQSSTIPVRLEEIEYGK